jgi:hypothetical protein
LGRKSTVENVGDLIGSAFAKAWHEATERADGPSPRQSNQSNGALSGLRGVIIGAGIGALAATKGAPLVKNAMMRYVTSHAMKAPDKVPSTDQAPTGSPAP